MRILYKPQQSQRFELLLGRSEMKHERTLRRAAECSSAVSAADNAPNTPVASHYRAISANTPHPRYSRVYAA
jgi:hypothetical protein